MSSEKRSQFLDAGDSDDDAGPDYDSEDDLQKGGRSSKRQRVEVQDSDAEEFSDQEEDRSHVGGAELKEDTAEPTGESKTKERQKSEKLELPDVSKPITKKNLVATEAAIKKSGVVYLSRIPPFMKPQKLRSLLEPYGKINRIFLTPEDPLEHSRRVRNGGNKKRSYTEGWVEFVKKKDAKKACDLLNAQTIGGKKSSWYRDDVWALKYLKGFKWHHLTEQIAAENAERASRMRAEISKTTRENKEFVRNVERAKVLNGMQSKATKRKKTAEEEEEEEEGGAEVAGTLDGGPRQERRRTFKQIPLAKKRKQDETQPEQVQRVLSKIF
ncbi:RNA-binding ATPase activator esf2 [Madurella fahalii]|uniref:18S rRNA factor 2 n=1 Tax=Madurella fahalii TaxID=1157608 RepID=A0ABQ0GLP5_9PEZI